MREDSSRQVGEEYLMLAGQQQFKQPLFDSMTVVSTTVVRIASYYGERRKEVRSASREESGVQCLGVGDYGLWVVG